MIPDDLGTLDQHRWVQGWHLNGFGTLFGGQLLSWVDEDTNMLCYNTSEKGSHFTTAGYDKVSFFRPCKAGDRLYFNYKIVLVGNRSVMIRCQVYNCGIESLEEGLTFSCITTMVRTEGKGLFQEFVDSMDKESPSWKYAQMIRDERKKFPPNLGDY